MCELGCVEGAMGARAGPGRSRALCAPRPAVLAREMYGSLFRLGSSKHRSRIEPYRALYRRARRSSDRAAASARTIIWTTTALRRHIIVYGSRVHPTRTLEQPSASQASCVRHQRRLRVLLPPCCSRLRLRAFLCTFQQSGMPREELRALGRLARRSTTLCGN